ncbi:hypothetical protein HYH03_005690 [Edaphochlamys debaryana]|uniref:ribonuclease Z n=1 Tax=Edaphochlamys debaryana TaxID=47281 RepID=A0A835Y6Q3_9CHLO|nr:hypothetical protein HYH03_005690 [Edaphochlamys debaryana]|eukprot:KAG2496087.1 hypothetical protein HYH03_005690 [Edaphochlamys debaryana]
MGKNKGQAAGQAPAAQPKQEGGKKQKGQQQEKQGQNRSDIRLGGMQHYTGFLQVLPLDIDHTSPSILLFFDKERYLFNAGEGIQRLFREHKLKIKQVNAYFITRISTETLGGLPGMALSVTPPESGGLLGKQAACTVKGPRGLGAYVAAFRGYVNSENTVDVQEIDAASTEPLYKSDVVSIFPIVTRLQPQPGPGAGAGAGGNGRGSPAADGEAEGASPVAKRQRREGGSGGPAAAEGSPSRSSDEEAPSSSGRGQQRGRGPAPASLSYKQVVSYLIRLNGRPGKFLPEKARALGVTPGPAFGELQRGHSVTLPDGRVVGPHEVAEPAVPGPSLLVLDTPHAGAMQALAADERLRAAAAEAASPDRLCVAVHMLPAALAADTAALEAWRSQLFGPGPSSTTASTPDNGASAAASVWKHVVVTSGGHQPCAYPRASVFQARLHAVHPTAFPLFALPNSANPPALPAGVAEAEAEAVAAANAGFAAAQEKAKKAAAAAAARAAAKAGGGAPAAGAAAPAGGAAASPGPGGAAAAAGGALTAAQLPQQPVLPYPEGTVLQALSAVRINLMPPQRQGLEYGDVFRYDGSAQVLEKMRSDPAYAEVLAAAAEVPGGGAAAAAAMDAGAEAGAAAAAEARPMAVDGAVDEAVPGPLSSGNRRMAELTFLGTASSQPSKYRNVSGCYVDLFDRGGLLVDCGEDAMGQLKRRFGGPDAERRMEELGLVWVSHMHADHHGGLYRLLEWRCRRGLPPLLVVGPAKLFDILVRYSAAVPIQFTFLPNFALSSPSAPDPPPPSPAASALAAAKERLGLAGFQPFQVQHIYDSHGLRLEGREGWVVVFSADTRPCEATVNAARCASLLVHEATFEESMGDEARAKKHSTTAEAVAVGEKALAYRTLLTHFSTRYPTLPELDLGPHPSVGVAMDLQSVNLADLPWLPRLVRPLGLLFKRLEEEKGAEGGGDEDD